MYSQVEKDGAMQIPLVDLKAQYAPLREEIMTEIGKVLDGMHLFLGPNLQAFEKAFAEFCGTEFCVGVADGTSAIHMALRSAGVGSNPEDEVITVSHSFIATTEAIWQAGARPVFVDIDPKTYTMDVSQVEGKITKNTKAIVVVHIHGQMADMVALRDIADRHGLILIEDSAQAHGATFEGKPAGSWGDLATFSFYVSKNLGAYGEAGAVVTSNPTFVARLRQLRDHGSKVKYEHAELGFNCRLDEIQAAVLRIKLPHLEGWNESRRRIAARYDELLQGSGVVLPYVDPRGKPVYHHYAVTTPHRDALKDFLQKREIFAGIHYPIPIHMQEACVQYGYKQGDLPVSEQYALSTLSLPIYAEMTDEQVQYVAQAVHDFNETIGVTSDQGRLASALK